MTATLTAGSATTATTATSRTAARRVGNVALWVLQVATAGLFVFAALPKLAANPQAVEGFAAMGLGDVGMYVVGALELLGAIALLIPRLCGLASLAFVALMVGAVVATWLTYGAGLIAMPAAVLVIVAGLAWARRRRTAELVALVRSYVR